jgi:hypothetical protein
MDPRKLFVDERLTGKCVYCGGEPTTRDHVPSKVLLDEPFPPDLPVVEVCAECNRSFSQDEQYVACFLECVLSGSSDPDLVMRPKIKRTLQRNTALAARIGGSCSLQKSGALLWSVESNRVQNVLLKLAQGHVAYDYSEPHLQKPKSIAFIPFPAMSPYQIEYFERIPTNHIYPEIGSRAFLKTVVITNEAYTPDSDWQVIQEGRYRYVMSHVNGIRVRMVLSEYLACEVLW